MIHFRGDGGGASALMEIGRMDEALAQAQSFADDSTSESLQQL